MENLDSNSIIKNDAVSSTEDIHMKEVKPISEAPGEDLTKMDKLTNTSTEESLPTSVSPMKESNGEDQHMQSEVQVSECPKVQVPVCPEVRVPDCPEVQVPDCSAVQVPDCPEVQVSECQEAQKGDISTSPDASNKDLLKPSSEEISTSLETNDTNSQTELCTELKIGDTEEAHAAEMDLKMDCTATKDVTSQIDVNVQGNDEDTLGPPLFWPYDLSKEFNTRQELKCIAKTVVNEFHGKYLKGCKWAPDGSCLLSNSDDNVLRVFNLPNSVYQIQDWNNSSSVEEDVSWRSALNVREGGLVYDFAWFPLMTSSDPATSCFLSTACDGPTHLFDAFTGSLRATYTAYNNVEEVAAAYSVAFDPYGEYIYCGFNQTVKIFNTSRPGRQCTVRVLKHKVLPDLSQRGIISCIAANPNLNGVYACGSYQRTVGLYLNDGEVLCILEGHQGGVTHLSFSHDGFKLFTGGRKDSRLICWDMRNTGEEYQIFERVVQTNQRVYFDVTRNDRYLISGGTDGNIRLWDLKSPDDPPLNIRASSDCVNGVSINPFVPILATASGQRHFLEVSEDMDSDVMFVDAESQRNAAQDINLWALV